MSIFLNVVVSPSFSCGPPSAGQLPFTQTPGLFLLLEKKKEKVPLGLTAESSAVCLYVGSLFCEDEARLDIAEVVWKWEMKYPCALVTLIMHWQSFDVKS